MSLLSENIFINGSFDVWLDGEEFADVATETAVATKWSAAPDTGCLVTVRKSDAAPQDSVCEYSLEISGGGEDAFVDLWQRVDARYAAQLQRVVVFSAMIYNGSDDAITPLIKINVPQNATDLWNNTAQISSASLQECAPGAWTRVSQAFDLSSASNVSYGCEFRLQFNPFPEDSLVRVTAAHLESRDTATNFTRRFYEQELALCKGQTYLDTALFDQDNSLLKADTAADPVSLAVDANTLVGNMGDGIAALTTAQAMPLWAALPAHYERDVAWAKDASVNTTLLSPNKLTVNVNDTGFYLQEQQSLDLSSSAAWDDTATTDYTTAANRAGKDFYIYACDNSGVLVLLLSANSTYPEGYDADTSRKIGGFHCLCADVGTITDHDLSGYVAGDIIPASVWDLKHRPVCSPEGMVYVAGIGKWVDIYLASVTDDELVSENGGTIANGTTSSPVFDWYDFAEWLGRIGKRFPTQAEFMALSDGSNQGTNIEGSAAPDPKTTGAHSDTAGQRMISDAGCEDTCGNLWQWLLETGGQVNVTGWDPQYSEARTSQRGQGYNMPTRGRAGGGWGAGAHCGSRSSDWHSSALTLSAGIGARGVAEPLAVAL